MGRRSTNDLSAERTFARKQERAAAVIAIEEQSIEASRQSRSMENPSVPIAEALDDDDGDGVGARATSGVRVNMRTALSIAAVWRACNLISRDVGKVPLLVYRRKGEHDKERDTKHPAYRLLRRRPNAWMTAMVAKQTVALHAVTRGNGYAYIQRNGAGEPVEYWPLSPVDTWPVIADRRLWYVARIDQELRKIDPDDMLHVKGLSSDGVIGYSMLGMARESFGLGLAAARWSSFFFRNGSRPGGIITLPGRLPDGAEEKLRRGWDRVQTGLTNSHKIAILQNGAKYQQITLSPEDAELPAMLDWTVRDVANWFGTPSHKLGDKEGQAYNSLEQENQSYLDDGIDPWLVTVEEEATEKFLTLKQLEQDSHYIQFNRKALVRADMAARAAYYEKALVNTWMLPNEVRSEEGYGPREGGDKPLPRPNASLKGNTAPDSKRVARLRRKVDALQRVCGRVIEDAGTRMMRRVGAHARRAAASPGKLAAWLEHELEGEHRQTIEAAFEPIVGRRRAKNAAQRLLGTVRKQLMPAAELDTSAVSVAVDARLKKLEQKLPRRLARELDRGPRR